MQKGTPVLGKDDTSFTSHPAVMEKRLGALRQSVSPGTLKQELHCFLHRHWRYDQNVFQDGIAQGSYAEKRRSDSRAIKGAEDIAGQYGACEKFQMELNTSALPHRSDGVYFFKH